MPFLPDTKFMFRMLTGSLLAAGLAVRPVCAQEHPAPPLFRFFQQHFDSTLVYQTSSNWYDAPDMLILAKQGQEVYFFTYRSPYRATRGRFVPGGLTRYFSEQEAHFRAAKPDTNRYLLPQQVRPLTLLQTWKNLRPNRLWKVNNTDPRPAKEQCIIDDAATETLHFLTRSGMRAASFYAPDLYEQCEGRGFNRGQVIHTRNILQALMKP